MIDSIVEWRSEVGRFQNVRCELLQCPRHNNEHSNVCGKCVGSIGSIGESKISKLLNLVKEIPNE